VNPELVRRVWRRAHDRCEYCKLPARFHPAPFQIDHIVARQHGGGTDLSNLALSCLHCNARKGPNIAGIDPSTGNVTRLFNPREDRWDTHFEWDGAAIAGRTTVGRVTVQVLGMNDPDFLEVRLALIGEGAFAVE
jgi:HNH endonuclease